MTRARTDFWFILGIIPYMLAFAVIPIGFVAYYVWLGFRFGMALAASFNKTIDRRLES